MAVRTLVAGHAGASVRDSREVLLFRVTSGPAGGIENTYREVMDNQAQVQEFFACATKRR
jgi:methylglyoxal synthase